MQLLFYCLVVPWIYLIAIIPFPLLYLFSDCIFILVYYVAGYRKKVVRHNLQNAFPGKTKAEILQLERKYFRWFCDMMLESFKGLTITRKTLLKHCSLSPEAIALFKHLHKNNRSAIAVMGHFGTWEWAGHAFALSCNQHLSVIYQPLHNPYFDRLVSRMRSRFGVRLVNMRSINRHMFSVNGNAPSVTTFLGDQSPQPERAYWMQFLNQETGVFPGTERYACRFDLPVVYVAVKRMRRGYYTIEAELLSEHPSAERSGTITEAHTQRLEKDISAMPETWLWSHRRWKYKRPAQVARRSFSFTSH
jgi:Kdo2-lipid IVA lauroyltransferase/acyltransferase